MYWSSKTRGLPSAGVPRIRSKRVSSRDATRSRASGEELGDPGEAVGKALGPARLGRVGVRFAREQVDSLGAGALSPDRPEEIRQVLARGGDLHLHRDGDIRERGGLAPVRRHAAEYPGAALVIHQAARAIDWIDDEAEAGLLRRASLREEPPPIPRQPLGNQRQRHLLGPARAMLQQDLLGVQINGVDRIAIARFAHPRPSPRAMRRRGRRRHGRAASFGARARAPENSPAGAGSSACISHSSPPPFVLRGFPSCRSGKRRTPVCIEQ
jgi:hypothetical protein